MSFFFSRELTLPIKTVKEKSSHKCLGRQCVSSQKDIVWGTSWFVVPKLLPKPWQRATWLIQIQQQPWGRWLRPPPLPSTDTAASWRPWETMKRFVLGEIDEFSLGGEKLHRLVVFCWIIFDFRCPPNDGETPKLILIWLQQRIIQRILGLLILYAGHRIISEKLATSNESAPESMQQPTLVGWFWWWKGDDGRCVMCPIEIWMCIKLLVDLDTSLKIIDEITPKTKKKLYENAACSNTKTFTGI